MLVVVCSVDVMYASRSYTSELWLQFQWRGISMRDRDWAKEIGKFIDFVMVFAFEEDTRKADTRNIHVGHFVDFRD